MAIKSPLSNQGALTDYIADRLANTAGAAEGSTLLPRQRGQGRIPIVTGLKVTQVNNYLGGSEFTLVWNDPQTSASPISGYNVYAVNLLGNNQAPSQVAQVNSSPAKVRVVGSQASVVTFYVQTVLSSGAVSALDNSPSCTSQVTAPVIENSDVHFTVTALDPGGANQIVGTNPSGTASEWKTLSGTANQITVTPGSGSINLSLASQLAFQTITLASATFTANGTVNGTTTTAWVDATSSNVTITTPATPRADQLLIIKRIDASANTVTIAPNTSQSVETTSLAANKCLIFQYSATGTIWRAIANF